MGRDMRLSSQEIADGLIHSLAGSGVDVVDIGLAGTEEVYHAVISGAEKGLRAVHSDNRQPQPGGI